MIYNIIFSLFFLIALNSYATGLPMKGLACHDTDPWTESEKTRFKDKLLTDNVTKFFFLSSQAYIKKDDFCAYKSKIRSFRIGFKENNDGGKIIFTPPKLPTKKIIQKYGKILWTEYGVYNPNYADDEFRELFRLKYRYRYGSSHPNFLTSAEHLEYFWHLDYMPFIIVTYDNKEKHLFVMKVM